MCRAVHRHRVQGCAQTMGAGLCTNDGCRAVHKRRVQGFAQTMGAGLCINSGWQTFGLDVAKRARSKVEI